MEIGIIFMLYKNEGYFEKTNREREGEDPYLPGDPAMR